MAMIELQNVSRRYLLGQNEVTALSSLNLTIEAGEYVAIIGQSGSGKSTLMNVLGCLDIPSSGKFLIDGNDISKLGPDELASLRRQRFGFIFQRYHLLPYLDALSNVALPAVYSGVAHSVRHDRAVNLLKRLGLAERSHHKPNELSGGQQQRVSIARALMNGGQIILADEPTGALDSQSGKELLNLLGELNALGHTIILVTHDAKVASEAKRVIELRDGQVLSDTATPKCHRLPNAPEEVPASSQLQSGGWWSRQRGKWQEALHSAFQSLKGNRLRTLLSIIGISIGVAAVVSMMALTTAARNSIENDVGRFLSGRILFWIGNPNISPGAQPPPFRLNEINAIRALPGVKGVNLEHSANLETRYGARNANVDVIGADKLSLAARKLELVEGRLFNQYDISGDSQLALIDDKASKALFKIGENPVGKTILLKLPNSGTQNTKQAVPENLNHLNDVFLPVTVVGIVKPESGGLIPFEAPIGQILVPIKTFNRKLDTRTDADQFTVLLDFSVPPDELRKQINYRLIALRGSENFESLNADETFDTIKNVTGALALLLTGVAIISLIVGGVGIMNIMLVSVSERTREIGIRMAVGARQADIHSQFMIEAMMLCLFGGLVGVILSLVAAMAINLFQNKLTAHIDLIALFAAIGVSTMVGLIFGTVPARRAAALSPVDALARE